ncbi:MAG: hypothetical protein CMJ94_08360 [Planctomycetes bacterium]|nr:hypothetical protein [Planctomycetota bacterium]
MCIYSVFVVDYAVFRYFHGRDRTLGQRIRDQLQELAYARVLPGRSTHLKPYVAAVRRPHERGPAWTTAMEFSRQCGAPESLGLIIVASSQFEALFKAAIGALEKLEIEG